MYLLIPFFPSDCFLSPKIYLLVKRPSSGAAVKGTSPFLNLRKGQKPDVCKERTESCGSQEFTVRHSSCLHSTWAGLSISW